MTTDAHTSDEPQLLEVSKGRRYSYNIVSRITFRLCQCIMISGIVESPSLSSPQMWRQKCEINVIGRLAGGWRQHRHSEI